MRILLALIIAILLPCSLPAADREFGSIGAQVVPAATGEVVVLQLVDNSPAARAGLLPGDLIVQVNGVDLEGLDFKTVTREHLWGFVGEPVNVGWLRPGEVGLREAELVRVNIAPELLRHPDVKMVRPQQ